jgi:methionine salvage enolase-phosphatase E1
MKKQTQKIYDVPRRTKFAMELIKQKETGSGTLADVVYRAGYHPKSRAVAKSNACVLKKHPEVVRILTAYKDILDQKLSPEVRAEKLAELAVSDDKRVSLAALQEVNRIFDEYPAGKLKVAQYNDELNRLQE